MGKEHGGEGTVLADGYGRDTAPTASDLGLFTEELSAYGYFNPQTGDALCWDGRYDDMQSCVVANMDPALALTRIRAGFSVWSGSEDFRTTGLEDAWVRVHADGSPWIRCDRAWEIRCALEGWPLLSWEPAPEDGSQDAIKVKAGDMVRFISELQWFGYYNPATETALFWDPDLDDERTCGATRIAREDALYAVEKGGGFWYAYTQREDTDWPIEAAYQAVRMTSGPWLRCDDTHNLMEALDAHIEESRTAQASRTPPASPPRLR